MNMIFIAPLFLQVLAVQTLTLPDKQNCYGVRFLTENRLEIGLGDGKVILMNTDGSARSILDLKATISSYVFSGKKRGAGFALTKEGSVVSFGYGKAIETFRPNNTSVNDIALSPDDQTLAVSLQNSIYLVNAATHEVTATLDSSRPFAFSPDSSKLATSYKKGILTFSVPSGIVSTAFPKLNGSGAIAYSPDGKVIVGRNLEGDGATAFFDVKTGDEKSVANATGDVLPMAFSSDGDHLLEGTSFGRALLLSFSRPKYRYEFKGTNLGDRHPAAAVAFSPSGKKCAVAYSDATIGIFPTNVDQ